jgi:hypothetical protein
MIIVTFIIVTLIVLIFIFVFYRSFCNIKNVTWAAFSDYVTSRQYIECNFPARFSYNVMTHFPFTQT